MIAIADQALNLLKKSSDPYSDIKRTSAYWIPLQWLYVRMIENKYIIPLSELSTKEKQRLWRQAVDSGKQEQWIRVSICQALYVFENVKNG